jgi:hypothetical protein
MFCGAHNYLLGLDFNSQSQDDNDNTNDNSDNEQQQQQQQEHYQVETETETNHTSTSTNGDPDPDDEGEITEAFELVLEGSLTNSNIGSSNSHNLMKSTSRIQVKHYFRSSPPSLSSTSTSASSSLFTVADENNKNPNNKMTWLNSASSSSSSSVGVRIGAITSLFQNKHKKASVGAIHHPEPKPYDAVTQPLPPPPPSEWLQGNLMLRATPGSNTHIKGVRYSSSPSTDYVLRPECTEGSTSMSTSTMQLPINNGLEKEGQCLVIDFESDLFVGTALLRVRTAAGDKANTNKSNNYYFEGRQRQFQAVIRGTFKTQYHSQCQSSNIKNIPLHECVTGQIFDQAVPKNKLPSKWVLNSAVKFLKVLSPHLSVRFDQRPYFLSPLIPTAQTVAVEEQATSANENENSNVGMERNLEEPCEASKSILSVLPNARQLMQDLNACKTVANRVALRKQAFNKHHSNSSSNTNNHEAGNHTTAEQPAFDTNKEYTFEFFQHLLNLDECSMNMLGTSHDLSGMLHGQPIKCLAAHLPSNSKSCKEDLAMNVDMLESLRYLWSFDIWHAKLHPDA